MIYNFEEFDKIKMCFKRSCNNTTYLCHRYLIDYALMYVTMAAAKFFTGAHRPHFFATCQPDKMLTCTVGTFISDYKCMNPDASTYKIYDASTSFYSGHAATCVYSCLFICWYLQKRVKSESPFMIPFIQTILICISYYGSISRVLDHRHHWWDVLAGAVVGILTTYHAVIFYP